MRNLDGSINRSVFFDGEDEFQFSQPSPFAPGHEQQAKLFGDKQTADEIGMRKAEIPEDEFLQALSRANDVPFKAESGKWDEKLRAYYNAERQCFALAQGRSNLAVKLPGCNDISAWSHPVQKTGAVTIPRSAIATEWETLVEIPNRDGYWFRCTGYGTEYITGRGPLAVRYRILVGNRTADIEGGGEFTNFTVITMNGQSVGERGSMRKPRSTFFTATQEEPVRLQVRRNAPQATGSDLEIQGLLQGYYWRLTNDDEVAQASMRAK